ncbi:enolase C-terminal domain-like protein [Streptomyces sp. TRM 70361]|uniref:enolase C-terminal domain-like protein n=1 Tax=Streptomyces sp. TRM 70361 TaxID=3116553 RepID=UPI002E7B39CB|nr:enolase C-terminal domain-like protein [Streptomyces sp. TRM 70361]MEE1939738.1 enolase C-terminal domain-like protein [Streptomyces sp. TRM 70361]
MRITGISTHVVGTPWRDLAYVQVHTDEGLTGVGETRMPGHTDALLGCLREAEANHIAGSGPFEVEDLVRRMKYGDYGRAGEIVMSGIAVVETACWDIKGKAPGVPVRQLPGGRVAERVKAYANGRHTAERTPEAFHAAARKAVERGYRTLELDPFGTGHLGGILGTRKLAATAETHYLTVAPHNAGGPVLTAASLQPAGCTPNFRILERFNDFADAEITKVATGAPKVVDGYFTLPGAPGPGAEPDTGAAAEFPPRRARFDLWAEGWEKRPPRGART